MVTPAVAVVIPTLTAGAALEACVASLAAQTRRDFETIVVDNSGRGLAAANTAVAAAATIITNDRNIGFGAAVNQGIRRSQSAYIASLNDDAVAEPRWLEALVSAMDSAEDIGMCASQVRLAEDRLDSAGMLIARDASSKQRGHLSPPERFGRRGEVLCPSGSAALYRRTMLDMIGLFEESFFLYCEDTDLGLRAAWMGWRCLYVPEAIVEHHYSLSAGRASPLKAYYVERNRLYTAVRNLPASGLALVPFASVCRYLWHVWYLAAGRGITAEYSLESNPLTLVWLVLRAHGSMVRHLGALLMERRQIRRTAQLSSRQYCRLLRAHRISLRQVAAL